MTTLLVDTSVWIDYLRQGNSRLEIAIRSGNVVMHTMVIAELACGNLSKRTERPEDWRAMPSICKHTRNDIVSYIDERRLMGRGLGFIDVCLLSAVESEGNSKLWTRDRALLSAAREIGVAFEIDGT